MGMLDKARAVICRWLEPAPGMTDLQADVDLLADANAALAEQLSAACARADNAEDMCGRLSADMDWLAGELAQAVERALDLQSRLDRIAAKGEASHNGTARLMAKIARGEA